MSGVVNAAQHHHRSTTKVSHKAFKSRHASKSDVRDRSKGKVGELMRQTKQQHVMSKLDRKNQAKQKRLNNAVAQAKANSIFTGREGAPRIVAVVPLCGAVDVNRAVKQLNDSVEVPDDMLDGQTFGRFHIDRFKQNVMYLPTGREVLAVLDACRMADYVLWVMHSQDPVDELGELLLKSAESQGISNVLAAVQGIDPAGNAKKKSQVLSSLKSFISYFLPTVEKVNCLESAQECQNMMRILCTSQPRGIHWREERSWMMVENVEWTSNQNQTSTAVLTGVVRGKDLTANRLVQVGDWGDFQIESIRAAPLAKFKKTKGDAMAICAEDGGRILQMPSEEQDNLIDLAPEEAVMQDVDPDVESKVQHEQRKGVLIDNHHYFSEEDGLEELQKPKRLPRGTSDYQAAWYIGQESDSGSDMEDVEDEMEMGLASPSQDIADGRLEMDSGMRDGTEAGITDYASSEMFLDLGPDDERDQIAEYRRQRQQAAAEDLEFPDEIELSPHVLARERLAKYRGLKNLRSSVWDTSEDKIHQPEAWPRLLEIANYNTARKRVLKEGGAGGVTAGVRVQVYLKNVPVAIQESYDRGQAVGMYSLLRHEHKRTAVNYSINLSRQVKEPIRSKQEIIVQCGPRRFIINPLFSDQGNTANDVHRFKRFLHAGESGVVSFIGPLTWGPAPILYLQSTCSPLENSEMQESPSPSPSRPSSLRLIGTGTNLAASQDRVIAKRIILTGHAFKIHKRVTTVRYMFFNVEDVQWFKALRLWTKRGRSGAIKESLGTHGYFKATFDAKINPMDPVAVSLYKRVWPRNSTNFVRA